ncbi:hypothetical protein Tsubulata_015092 [Turnera subulata]|uniref:UDP-N-acetylglucosamine--dolichyl-phosphate N-acetylglucosaminephosphotransferase n=1 Tax=Turnera subulata TaxID=218843 RepID=A0A9Q0G7Z4_9ROSI|nr:hypothetical protein Tsubulata_015092 [Turnera subulata]
MAARKRAPKQTEAAASSNAAAAETKTAPVPESKPATCGDVGGAGAAIAPPKWGFTLKMSLILLAPYLYLLLYHFEIQPELKRTILINAGFSVVAFWATLKMIPVASRYLLRRNLFGYDINKKGTPQGAVKVPESLGIVVSIVFLVVAILFQYFNFTADSNWLVEYNAAIACICFMTLLGFVDDVLDVPWRVKLLVPAIASLALLMAYAGHTTIIVPKPLVELVGAKILDLVSKGVGAAGLNCKVNECLAALAYLTEMSILQIDVDGIKDMTLYPSAVFVGDTYTLFAGMTLAVVGILGHFTETLMIFFAAEIFNFVASVPQLFGFWYCPRHRLPRFDPQTGLLTGTTDWTLVNIYLRIFGRKTEKALCVHLLVVQVLFALFLFMKFHPCTIFVLFRFSSLFLIFFVKAVFSLKFAFMISCC